MALDKFRIIGWLFVAALASGLSMIFAGKVLHMPLAIVHKLRSRGRIRWEKKLRIWGGFVYRCRGGEEYEAFGHE